MGAFVYMLRCKDGSYYVGSTRSSLEARVAEHNSARYGGYTSTRRSVELVYSQEFSVITDAIAAERQLKGWGRAKKEALVRGDIGRLKELSKRGQKETSSFVTPPVASLGAAPQDEV